MNDHAFEALGITVAYDSRVVISGLDFAVPSGAVTVIVGPNACGKSTLLRSMAGLHRVAAGEVRLDGESIERLGRRTVARTVAVLPQSSTAPDGVRVGELVARGRYPHQGWFGFARSDDDQIVAKALSDTGIADLADRRVEELSGGQRQRVWIAMVLAQDSDIVLLDEPTTYLDVTHQLDLLDLLADLNRERGTTVVMVLHELNLAARYADHLVMMRDGAIVAQGPPAEVVTADAIRDVFGLDSHVIPDPVSGTPLVVPVGRSHAA
ncbi:iron dicitrate ABC transporter ATP-binding protein [Tessaracoccus aquimaris]|uniref:Iron dicitrate ABC transporter ATP-binding protein n=1 Tax=Tessaracoccus aquimaris TaxID=1332264 RepID=A0A1Q2CQ49_9ACTN|nr:ABC transporter ATP-binding protein [Tessaracoccus aquimaris]AQP48224.1 iron dicitrate ABC transporter ATP-binding protein [Tessaracoccus aquimaris]